MYDTKHFTDNTFSSQYKRSKPKLKSNLCNQPDPIEFSAYKGIKTVVSVKYV